MHALPALRFSDEALMRWVGFNAHPVRQGVCQRGAAKRQGPRTEGPICPDTGAANIVKRNRRAVEALFNGVIGALAKAGMFAATVTGRVDAPDLETTAQYEGGGPVTRQRRSTDTRGQEHEIEVTIYGWQLIVVSDAATQIPWAGPVGPSHAPAGLSMRALVTQARTNLAGSARLHTVVGDRGFWDGPERWGLDQQGILFVVPAQDHMAATVEAHAQAAAGAGVTMGRRAHTVRHGQGQTARTERRETAVVGITGLTTSEPYGTSEHGRPHHRRDFQPNPLNAVGVRTWHHRDSGPGGQPVFLTHARVDQPWRPFDDDDDRSLIETCGMKDRKQPWSLPQPPQKTARAVRVHVLLTGLMVALATAYRLPCEPVEAGADPIGWQRWRRHLLEQTRDMVIICAEDCYGIFPLAEYSLLWGVKLKDIPPGIGTRRDILAQYRLVARG